ncbi:MAG: hypothetical protein QF920_05015, partial [Verrucomicrobiota bacterium]|nr:hypothetical protein [Verrucomicrobiota bacterium]
RARELPEATQRPRPRAERHHLQRLDQRFACEKGKQPERALELFEAMQRQGVITRPMGGYGLPEWIRLSIGTAKENQRATESLKAALA